jgi:hypothetical protein
MLRITLPSRGGSQAFVLDGRLTGLWAKELLRVAREAMQSCGKIFDLQAVFFVDSAGEHALRMLSGYGARFIADSAYGKDLCRRLKLRRVTALELENDERQRLNNSAQLKDTQAKDEKKIDSITSKMKEQHPVGCRE